MAKICGIELKSSDAILAIIEKSDGDVELIDVSLAGSSLEMTSRVRIFNLSTTLL